MKKKGKTKTRLLDLLEMYVMKPAVYLSAIGEAITLLQFNRGMLGIVIFLVIIASLFYLIRKYYFEVKGGKV